MSDWFACQVADLAYQRHTELVQIAQSRRRARSALAASARKRSYCGPWLAWLGSRLVVWGWWLQKRYGASPLH